MSMIRKLAHLKDLPDLQPDAKWAKATKYNLLIEIAAQNKMRKAAELDFQDRWNIFTMNFGVRMMSQATKVIAAILVLSLGSGVGLAAQASVPGEALWPVKRSLEKAEVTLTISPVKETEVHIKHINNRLYEIEKILNEGSDQDTSKTEKAIKQAAKHLEKDVVAVDSSLKVAREEKDPVAVVALVEKVTNATKETASNLQAKASGTQDKVIEQVLDSAKKVNEDVKTSAVSLALEVHQEVVANAVKQDSNPAAVIASSSATQLSENNPKAQEVKTVTEVVTKILTSEIKDLSSEVQSVKDKAETVDKKNLNTLSQISSNTKEDNKAIVDVNILKKNPEAAQDGLNEAKDLLEKGALKDTLDKIVEVKEKTVEAETALKQIEEMTDENNKAEAEKNSTSTPTINPNTSSTSVQSIEAKPVRFTGEEVLSDNSLDIKAEDGIIVPLDESKLFDEN